MAVCAVTRVFEALGMACHHLSKRVLIVSDLSLSRRNPEPDASEFTYVSSLTQSYPLSVIRHAVLFLS